MFVSKVAQSISYFDEVEAFEIIDPFSLTKISFCHSYLCLDFKWLKNLIKSKEKFEIVTFHVSTYLFQDSRF